MPSKLRKELKALAGLKHLDEIAQFPGDLFLGIDRVGDFAADRLAGFLPQAVERHLDRRPGEVSEPPLSID